MDKKILQIFSFFRFARSSEVFLHCKFIGMKAFIIKQNVCEFSGRMIINFSASCLPAALSMFQAAHHKFQVLVMTRNFTGLSSSSLSIDELNVNKTAAEEGVSMFTAIRELFWINVRHYDTNECADIQLFTLQLCKQTSQRNRKREIYKLRRCG